MNNDVKLEIAELITNQEKLHGLLSSLPAHALKEFPALQKHLVLRSQKSRELQQAIRRGDFTESQWNLEILNLLDTLGYEIVQQVDLTPLNNRVLSLVGSDIKKINELTVQDVGSDVLSELMVHMASEIIEVSKTKVISYPWLAERGRVDHSFYRHLDQVFDAWNDGFRSHYKLNEWCIANIGTRCPQSAPKFFKDHGNPRYIKEWSSYAESQRNT